MKRAIPDASAYVGEVLLNATSDGSWVRPPRNKIRWTRPRAVIWWPDGGYHDPQGFLLHFTKKLMKDAPHDYLQSSVKNLAAWLSNPTLDQAKSLGWEMRMPIWRVQRKR